MRGCDRYRGDRADYRGIALMGLMYHSGQKYKEMMIWGGLYLHGFIYVILISRNYITVIVRISACIASGVMDPRKAATQLFIGRHEEL